MTFALYSAQKTSNPHIDSGQYCKWFYFKRLANENTKSVFALFCKTVATIHTTAATAGSTRTGARARAHMGKGGAKPKKYRFSLSTKK